MPWRASSYHQNLSFKLEEQIKNWKNECNHSQFRIELKTDNLLSISCGRGIDDNKN